MKKLFIGIDFSKKKYDVSVLTGVQNEPVSYASFDNTEEGCIAMLQWLTKQTAIPPEEWLFCGEYTGLYSVVLSTFLVKKNLFIWLETPLQIKQSTGIKREKNDKIDSYAIAMYAYRFQDKATCYRVPGKALKSLSLLLSFRGRLLRNKHCLLVSSQETRKVIQKDPTSRYVYEQSKKDIERINKEIKAVEKRMKAAIDMDETIKENYELITSIKGISLINASAILIHTNNFTGFETSRQFACYAGVVPFGKQSGSSVHGAPHVSYLANKQIKVLLTQAAKCAIRYDANLRNYYQRKTAEGKKNWLVINNVRNKLIHRIFALVKNKQPYRVDYINQIDKSAA